MTSFQGTITRHAGADLACSMTFGSPARILMTITPGGELQFGDHIHPKAIAEMLVAEFGRNYNSELAIAEETARECERRVVRAERDAAGWKDRCAVAERKLEDYRKAAIAAAKAEVDALGRKAGAMKPSDGTSRDRDFPRR